MATGSRLLEARMQARLARWLGPWTPETARPRGVTRRLVRVDGRFDSWVYRSVATECTGSLLVLPGLHYLGPADERLDRFLCVLANAGIFCVCPMLPEFRALRVGPSLIDDARLARAAMMELPDRPSELVPGVFTISFGSYPGIHLAAEGAAPRLLLFGGYARFEHALRFALAGTPERPHNPLNPPVVFMALAPFLEGAPDDPEPLRAAWASFTRRTWGKPEMKAGGWRGVAEEMAARLAPELRDLFLLGTGFRGDPGAAIERALERGRHTLSHTDVIDACRRVTCPTTIVHGRDDDVIPFAHAQMLADAMPNRPTVLLTGLYAHTGAGVPTPGAAVDEARTMGRIVKAIVETARNPA